MARAGYSYAPQLSGPPKVLRLNELIESPGCVILKGAATPGGEQVYAIYTFKQLGMEPYPAYVDEWGT